MNDAGAALAGIATDMCAGEAELVTQHARKQRSRFDIHGDWITVHGQGYNRHNCGELRCGGGRQGSASKIHHENQFENIIARIAAMHFESEPRSATRDKEKNR